MSRFEIVRKEGSLKWHIYCDQKFVIRHPTKLDATLWIELAEGNTSRAPEAYRRQIHKAEKQMGRRDALRSAILWAQMLGAGPETVRADPSTGEPL